MNPRFNFNFGFTGRPPKPKSSHLQPRELLHILQWRADRRYERFKDNIISINKSDFDDGTVILSEPGYYRLDLFPDSETYFNPNESAFDEPYNSGQVLEHQFYPNGPYSRSAFGIGFFAAISIVGKDITLDLNGMTLNQSKEHALQQRFYANIELGSAPFISGQGPHDFGSNFQIAENVCICNGTIGRSGHHGIHANFAKNILIDNVQFEDHELAAIHMNASENIVCNHCVSINHKADVPILGIFSSARFLRRYMDLLLEAEQNDMQGRSLTIQGVSHTVENIHTTLRTALNIAYEGIIEESVWWSDQNDVNELFELQYFPFEVDGKTINETYQLFHNSAGIVDGNLYGFGFHGHGMAVNGFPVTLSENPSKNIYLINCSIGDMNCNINEVPALSTSQMVDVNNLNPYESNLIMNDAVGAVFQTQNKYDGQYLTVTNGGGINSVYKGNCVSNAQLLIAKYVDDPALQPLDTTRMSINQDFIIDWVANVGETLSDAYEGNDNTIFVCNGDAMFHVDKGAIVYRLDSVDGLVVRNCKIGKVSNIGAIGSTLYGDYEKSHPFASRNGYGGADVRCISLSSTQNAQIENFEILGNIVSECGSVIGVDAMFDTKAIYIDGMKWGSESVMEASINKQLSDYVGNPTAVPACIGFRIDRQVEDVSIKNTNIDQEGQLKALEQNTCIYESNSTKEINIR
jgi:hypothetical protein